MAFMVFAIIVENGKMSKVELRVIQTSRSKYQQTYGGDPVLRGFKVQMREGWRYLCFWGTIAKRDSRNQAIDYMNRFPHSAREDYDDNEGRLQRIIYSSPEKRGELSFCEGKNCPVCQHKA